jgi:hypothetical protein
MELLSDAVDEMVSSTFDGFAAWLRERAERPLTPEAAKGIAAVGLSALVGSRLMKDVLLVPAAVQDDVLVETWVGLMLAAIARPA